MPLREEHVHFLKKTLLPLHTHRSLSLYYSQLAFCILQFVEKDPSLTPSILEYLFKHWPKFNSQKEVLLWGEVEEILETCLNASTTLANLMPIFGKQLASSLQSPHFQVTERCLMLWNSDSFRKLLLTHRTRLFPLIIPPMIRYSKQHWNKNVQVFVFNALRITMEMDPVLFELLSTPLNAAGSLESTTAKDEADRRALQWAALEQQVAQSKS